MSSRDLPLFVLLFASLALPTRAAPAQPQKADAKTSARVDIYGDPLPTGALARLGTVRWRHGGPVFFVGLLPDGKQLVTASQDGWLRVLDAATGKELRRFGKPSQDQRQPEEAAKESVYHYGSPAPVALSADGRFLATALSTGRGRLWRGEQIRVWDVAAGKELWNVPLKGTGSGMAFAPGGKTLVAQGWQALLQWDVAAGKERDGFPQPENSGVGNTSSEAHQFAFSPDGNLLAGIVVASEGGQVINVVKLWKVQTGKILGQIKGRHGDLSCLAFSPDSKHLALPSPVDDSIRLWDVHGSKEIRRIKGSGSLGRLNTLAFSPDGKILASKAANRILRLWDVSKGCELRSLEGPFDPSGAGEVMNGFPGGVAQELVFSPDGKVLFCASNKYLVRRWEVATGKELLSAGHTATVRDVTFSPDGKVLTTLAEDGVRQWDRLTGKELRQVRLPQDAYRTTLAPNGRTLAFLGNQAVHLWDLATFKELRRWPLPEREKGTDHCVWIYQLRFSQDGNTLIGHSIDGPMYLWRTVTGKKIGVFPRTFDDPAGGGNAYSVETLLAIAPDGKQWVTIETLGKVIQFSSKGELPSPSLNPVTSVLRFHDAASTQKRRQILAAFEITAGVFSSDGRNLVTAGKAQTLSIWEVATGQRRYQFKAGGSLLAVSPDCRTLATAVGPTLQLWDLVTGQRLGEFQGHLSNISALTFAADGKTVASGSSDTTVLVWEVPERIGKNPPALAKLTPKQVEALWGHLATENAVTAFRAMQTLAASPGPAVAELRKRLPPIPEIPPQRLAQLIAGLGSNKFEAQQTATKALEQLGELAEPALKEQLASGSTALEVRRRLELLLNRPRTLTQDQLRQLRAVEVLEWMATAESRKLLETLASGASGARQTQEARAALERLRKRQSDKL